MGNFPKTCFMAALLLLVLSACQGNTTPAATVTTLQVMQTPLPSVTASPLPSATKLPTEISSQTPTPTQAPATDTLEPAPTLPQASFAKTCYANEYYTKVSPNGLWLAEYCSDGIMYVSNQDATKVFPVDIHDYYSNPLYPQMTGTLRPVHWSKDNHYIYFTARPEQWNDGVYAISEYAPTLYRMDILDGEIIRILQGAFYHSFSPTERRMIEIQEFQQPIKIIIHDLKTGDIQTFVPNNDAKYGQAADVVWSQDGLRFVLVGAYGEYIDQPNRSDIILINLADSSQKVIVPEIEGSVTMLSWDESDNIFYRVYSYTNNQTTTYAYNLQTQEISIVPTNE